MENRRATNPVFARVEKETELVKGYGASYKGITIKTAILLLTVVISGVGSIFLFATSFAIFMTVFVIALILGFVSVIVASINPRLSPTFSVIYSVCEGVWLGTLTLIVGVAFPQFPVALWAVLITIGIFIAMLVLYATKLVVATTRFRKVMFGISFSILSIFLIVGLVSIFDGGSLWNALFVNPDSPLVLFITLLFILYGAFMLVINFDNAKLIVANGADKKYEWTVSLGLVVSIVYIYVQVIRLLLIVLSRSSE